MLMPQGVTQEFLPSQKPQSEAPFYVSLSVTLCFSCFLSLSISLTSFTIFSSVLLEAVIRSGISLTTPPPTHVTSPLPHLWKKSEMLSEKCHLWLRVEKLLTAGDERNAVAE